MKATIAGLPGAGKTSLLHKLTDFYKIKPISIGDLRGEFAQKEYNETIDELNERRKTQPEVDILFDKYQKKYMATHKKFIIEGKISYIFAPKNSINIFLVADKLIRTERIFKDPRKDEKQCSTFQEVEEMLDLRIASDIETYFKLYQTNCYNTTNFDLAIDTTFQTKEEVFNQTIQKITNHKKLIKKYNLNY